MPAPFLDVVVHDLDSEPYLCALCAGFEDGRWRADQFARHLIEWLPEFALAYRELATLDAGNAVALVAKAAESVYQTKKFAKRGEFGELILHAVLRQVYGTIPAISKLYYKDGPNETVKGFDAVHVVQGDDGLELWLGEAKFYKSLHKAIDSVVKELEDHTKTDYLRREFVAITNKIDDEWPHAEALKRLLHKNTSLDDVFARTCIPVLLTYDSNVVATTSSRDETYRKAFEDEVRKHAVTFVEKCPGLKATVHLLLVPMGSKDALIESLEAKLRAVQVLA